MVNFGRIIEIEPGYAASETGQILCRRSINGKGKWSETWRPLKPLLCSDGRYSQVSLLGKKPLIHRLVAAAFHGPCPKDYEVAHLNGDSSDNRPQNLKYVPHSENELMKKKHGTDPAGERNGASKLTKIQVANIKNVLRNGHRGRARQLAREYGVSEATISHIKHRKRWWDKKARKREEFL